MKSHQSRPLEHPPQNQRHRDRFQFQRKVLPPSLQGSLHTQALLKRIRCLKSLHHPQHVKPMVLARQDLFQSPRRLLPQMERRQPMVCPRQNPLQGFQEDRLLHPKLVLLQRNQDHHRWGSLLKHLCPRKRDLHPWDRLLKINPSPRAHSAPGVNPPNLQPRVSHPLSRGPLPKGPNRERRPRLPPTPPLAAHQTKKKTDSARK